MGLRRGRLARGAVLGVGAGRRRVLVHAREAGPAWSRFKYLGRPDRVLPTGLTIDEDTGTISGTPTAEGTYPLKIIVVDGRGNEFVITCGDIVIDARRRHRLPRRERRARRHPRRLRRPTSTTTAPPRPAVVRRTPHWTATNLPPGLTIDPANGLISRHADETGIFTVTITATDDTGLELTGERGVLEIRDLIVVDT